MDTLAAVVAAHAAARPDATAFVGGAHRMSWADYDARSDRLAGELVAAGYAAGDRVAVMLPDGPAVHTAFLAIEKAGCVIVGIGPRAGDREVEHLLRRTGAAGFLSTPDTAALAGRLGIRHHVVEEGDDATASAPAGDDAAPRASIGPDDLWLLNSTSGTTGLPKCVMHHQRRWFAFHDLAVPAGGLSPDDVFMSVLPAPFGFGIWTAHFT